MSEMIDFRDYRSDMDELGTAAAGAVSVLRDKVDERDRAILWLLRAAGGKITVPFDIMADLGGWTMEVTEDNQNQTRTFRALPSPPEN